jgi:hypothetical protein
LHLNTLTDEIELYNLVEDPSEQVNLAERDPQTAQRLLQELKRHASSTLPTPELSKEQIEHLKSLGYVR